MKHLIKVVIIDRCHQKHLIIQAAEMLHTLEFMFETPPCKKAIFPATATA